MAETDNIIKQRYATTFHTLFCQMPHSDNMMDMVKPRDGICNWYIEETMENTWEKTQHAKWLFVAEIVFTHIKKHSVMEEEKIISTIHQLCHAINALQIYDKALYEIFKSLL